MVTPLRSDAKGSRSWLIDHAESALNALYGDYLGKRHNALDLGYTIDDEWKDKEPARFLRTIAITCHSSTVWAIILSLQQSRATRNTRWGWCLICNMGDILFTLCQFSPLLASMIARILADITGYDFKTMDLLTFGERALNLKRAINNILGVTREDDKIPDIARKALNEGGTAGIEPDMDMMLKEFYTVSKWDWENGKPTKEKLHELRLNQAAKALWG